MMLGAVDTVMLSQYSDNSVAAVGVVNQLIMFAFLIFEVINIGTSVLCSQYLGARMHKNMVQVVGVSLILNLAFGLFVSAILHYGATFLLSMMGLRSELMEYGGFKRHITHPMKMMSRIRLVSGRDHHAPPVQGTNLI